MSKVGSGGAAVRPGGPALPPFVPGLTAINSLASNAVRNAALIAAGVLAILQVGYQSLYGDFGVRLDEAGLDRGTIIARALLGLVFMTAIAGLVFVPVTTGFRGFTKRLWARHPTATEEVPVAPAGQVVTGSDAHVLLEAEWLFAALAPLVWVVYMTAQVSMLRDGRTLPYWIAAAALAAWVFAWWSLRHVRRGRAYKFRHALMFAVLVSVASLVVISDYLGLAVADSLRAKGTVPTLMRGPFATLEVRADCVKVHLIQPLPGVSLPVVNGERVALFLGQAGGTDLLYDLSQGHPLRMPTSDVSLESVSRSQYCSAAAIPRP